MRRIWAIAAAVLFLTGWVGLRAQQTFFNPVSIILNSKHDFRATSTTATKSVTGNDPCVFCHTPHNATPGPELWNHTMSTTNFPTYSSSTSMSPVGTITDQDSSKLCLSCHDGTIALGSTVNNGMIDFVNGPNYMLPATSTSNLGSYSPTGIGVGFADDHPFAFAPNAQNPEIKPPAIGDPVKLELGKVQCTSCHDPHRENTDTTTGKFLVKVNQASALCMTCHATAGWTGSAHQAPPDPIQDQKYTATQGAHTGYVGVANNGCESCHKPHSAMVGQRLGKFVEENTCYACHNGSVTTVNINTDITSKTYHHPVDTTPSVHDAAEGPITSGKPIPETSVSVPRHAECEDCHNPHMTKPTPPGSVVLPPAVTPPQNGTTGWSTSKVLLKQATNQYETCFKCHSDSANRPQLTDVSNAGIGFGRNPKRQYNVGNPDAFNTRVEFTQSTSYHPVAQVNPLGLTTSLRPNMIDASGTAILTRPLSATALIYCSDCHASDTNRTLGAGNTGAAGPHGSNIQHLLERQNLLEVPPATPGGTMVATSMFAATNFAMCDKCHDVTNLIYNATTGFNHQKHLDKGSACSTCHDPHASKSSLHLINFDLAMVGPSSTGAAPQYTSLGAGHGSCTLTCHGTDHAPKTY